MRGWPAVMLAAAGVVGFAAVEVERLEGARRAEQVLHAAALSPVLSAAPADMLVAPDTASAAARLARLLADRASADGIAIAAAPATADAPGFVAVDIGATAPEAALRRFAQALESGRPAVRLARWSVEATSAGAVFRARAIAPWRR